MMQITTVHKLQHALDAFIKVLQFVWRHALTLIVVGMIVTAFAIGKISWTNCLYFYVGAVFLDRLKMKLKFVNGNHNYHQSSSITSFTQTNYWNSSIVGTPAYLSNLGRSD
ncbi:MAG: hypothetical protein WCN27_00865 [Alphaproteobacteria bacterium]